MRPSLPQRVLVTGGAGFVGSHLCERLLAAGQDVVCVDNLETGSRANIQHLLAHPGFEFVRHDVVNPLDVQVDRIFNLACPASPARYQRDPVRTLKTSVLGTLHLLEMAASQGARLVQASTSEVYGSPEQHPQPESYWGNVNPVGPRSCYDEGKRCAETLCADFARTRGTDARIARIFNTYGPRMDPEDGRVVSNFIVQALRGQPLTVYGAGRQTRSFCYVDDLVAGLMALMDTEDASLAAQPVNLGNPEEFAVIELARRVLEFTGSRSTIEHRGLPRDDPPQRRPVIERAGELLGWAPTVPLAEGLARTVHHFRRALAGRPAHEAVPAMRAGRLPSTDATAGVVQ